MHPNSRQLVTCSETKVTACGLAAARGGELINPLGIGPKSDAYASAVVVGGARKRRQFGGIAAMAAMASAVAAAQTQAIAQQAAIAQNAATQGTGLSGGEYTGITLVAMVPEIAQVSLLRDPRFDHSAADHRRE